MESVKPAHWVMDYETIVNCFIGVFQHYKDDADVKVFTVFQEGDQEINQLPELIGFLDQCAKEKQWHISFNGLAFDAQITEHLLVHRARYLKMTTAEAVKSIYAYAQSVIDKSNSGQFLEYAPFKMKVRQLDVFKLNHWDNRAKMSGLKWIQYSMDWENMQDMPHPHYEPVVNTTQLKEVTDYCINDVRSTKRTYEDSMEQIRLRQALSMEYNIDLYNASEPKISRELFLHFLNQKTGMDKSMLKEMRTRRPYIILAECILPYVEFRTPTFKGVLDDFRKKVITSTKDGFKFSVEYKGVKTDYGLGGIHGCREAGVYEAKPGWTIMTSDVKSFYPNLAIRNRFAPEHLPKEAFCELYEWFYDERVKIPKSDPKNYVYKIILNATYGLSGDENSFLYDPKFTMQITVNGQLSLSMLYEMICEEIPGAVPLMQNTDGLETMIPNAEYDRYMAICDRWCRLTKLELEHEEYQKMVIRDVNNYMAVYKNGKTKCKGFFEWEDLEKRKVAMYHKNKSFLVIPKAIYEYFVNGVDPRDYLQTNRNILDYCAGVKAKGDWKLSLIGVNDQGKVENQSLQKVNRYFVSNRGGKMVKNNPDGREIQIEAGQWLQTVMNKYDRSIPFEDYDVNIQYYLDAIEKEIEQIENKVMGEYTQLTLF